LVAELKQSNESKDIELKKLNDQIQKLKQSQSECNRLFQNKELELHDAHKSSRSLQDKTANQEKKIEDMQGELQNREAQIKNLQDGHARLIAKSELQIEDMNKKEEMQLQREKKIKEELQQSKHNLETLIKGTDEQIEF